MIRRVVAPRIDFSALRRELELPERFPPAAQAQADAVAAGPPPLPPTDRTDVPFVTIDPPGSLDLDQAMCLERRTGGGYRVQYAIADVAAYVRPDGALAEETWRRGETVYLPDGNVPLHPPVLSEGAASLLPDQVRAAVVWTIELDADGGPTDVRVERTAIRSRAKLNYPAVQADIERGVSKEPIALLPELGALLIERGLARGAINLPIPAQEVEPVDGGGWALRLRGPEPVENFNAQISLLTGMAAARIMLDGKVGLLRTMPPPPQSALDNLRTTLTAAHRGRAPAQRVVSHSGGIALLPIILVLGAIVAVVVLLRRRIRSGFGRSGFGRSMTGGPPPMGSCPDYGSPYGQSYRSGMGPGAAGAIGAVGGGLLGYELGKMQGEEQ